MVRCIDKSGRLQIEIGGDLSKLNFALSILVLYFTFHSRWSANALRARTDETGRFSFTSVAAGSYSIFAVAPGLVCLLTSAFSQAADEPVKKRLSVNDERVGIYVGVKDDDRTLVAKDNGRSSGRWT
jgi:hypothetical protein